MKKSVLFLSILIPVMYSGCGKGIEPEPEKVKEGFGGNIIFTGDWPDSVTRTHLVVFKDPLLSASDFNAFNLAFVGLNIPKGTSVLNYSTLDSALYPVNTKLQAGTYSYIAVAQQTTINLTLNRSDWFVAGVFYLPGDSTIPGMITIRPGEFLDNIDIRCDFNNPPLQPPGE